MGTTIKKKIQANAYHINNFWQIKGTAPGSHEVPAE